MDICYKNFPGLLWNRSNEIRKWVLVTHNRLFPLLTMNQVSQKDLPVSKVPLAFSLNRAICKKYQVEFCHANSSMFFFLYLLYVDQQSNYAYLMTITVHYFNDHNNVLVRVGGNFPSVSQLHVGRQYEWLIPSAGTREILRHHLK